MKKAVVWIIVVITSPFASHGSEDQQFAKYHPPIEIASEKERVYLECRGNELFLIPLEELKSKADVVVREIVSENTANKLEVFQKVKENTSVRSEHYMLDLSAYLLGQTIIEPISDEGLPLIIKTEGGDKPDDDWYREILNGINRDEQAISFLVRDDSYPVFKAARELAWKEQIDVAYELLPFRKKNRISFSSVPTPIMAEGMFSVITGKPIDPEKMRAVTYVDVHKDYLIIYPDRDIVPFSELDYEDNPFQFLLNRLKTNNSEEYIVFFVRPQTGHVMPFLKSMAKSRGIDVGYELYEHDQELIFERGELREKY